MPGPQPITPGEILAGLPSEGWNGFVEAYRRVMQGAGQPNGPGGSSGARRLTALVKNNTGAAIDVKFGVVELDGPLFNTDDRETVIHEGIAFKGIEPDEQTRSSSVAIFQGPVGNEQSMEAVIVGPTWVRLELPTWDQEYKTCGPTDGDCTKLTAGRGAIRIHWHATPEEATPPDEQETEVWALVELGGRGGVGMRAARVVDAQIDAATSNLEASYTDGLVKFMDDETGVLDEDSTAVKNSTPAAYPEDAWVWVDDSYSPPRIHNGTCSAFAGWDPA